MKLKGGGSLLVGVWGRERVSRLVPRRMRRRKRIVVEGREGFYHIVSRVNGGAHVLDEGKKALFRDLLERVAGFCGVEVLTFCFMDNHFHILVSVPGAVGELDDAEVLRRSRLLYGKVRERQVLSYEGIRYVLEQGGVDREAMRALLISRMGSLSMFVKILKQRFSLAYNRERGRVGTLWEGPFKSVLVEPTRSALSVVGAYIDLNPVRAGIVEDPKDYRFSGYGEAIGRGRLAGFGLMRRLAGLPAEGLEAGGGCASEVGEAASAKGVSGTHQVRRRSVGSLSKRLEEAAQAYRILLYVEGSTPVEGPRGQKKAGRVMSRKAMREVLARGGTLSTGELLRCRVRYMTDGAIIGSRGFIETKAGELKESIGPKKASPRPMRGGGWFGLCSLRDLRKDTIG